MLSQFSYRLKVAPSRNEEDTAFFGLMLGIGKFLILVRVQHM
jgi:hypothetical protein